MRKSPLEIGVFTASLLIILTAVCLFFYDGLTLRSKTVEIEAYPDLKHIRKNSNGYSIKLELSNKGNVSVQSLRLEFYFNKNGTEEISEIIVPFLPQGSKRYASVTFSQRPKKVKYRIVSYLLPR